MKKVQRYIPLEIQRDAITRTPEGYLVLPVTATRTGILPYVRPDGRVVKEARLPQDVFSQDSLDTIRQIPVTNDHPESGLVNAENARKLTVGWTGSDVKTRDNKFIETSVKIVDAATIDAIMKGKIEVSMGYEVEKEEHSGRFDGEEYDVVQRNIRYNHLAIVDRGRAGHEVRLRLDAADNEVLKKEEPMKKFKVGEKEFDVADELFDTLEQFKKDCSEKKKDAVDPEELKKAVSELDSARKDSAQLQAKLDEANSQIEKLKKDSETKLDADAIEKIAKERARVERIAVAVLDEKEAKTVNDKKTVELKKMVIKKEAPTIDEKKLENEVYVDARFDAIAERVSASNKDELRKVGTAITDAATTPEVNADEARKKASEKACKAWESKLSVSA